MDFNEREKLVRRISSKCLYGSIEFNHSKINVIIEDPSLSILTWADWIYQEKYNQEKSIGEIFTLEESFKILEEQGKWGEKLEKEVIGINKDLKNLNEKSNSLNFQKREKNRIIKTIEKGKKRLEELSGIKNQLWEHTLECHCLKRKRHFLMEKCTKGLEEFQLKNPNILNILANLYYIEQRITLGQIRELARSDPWRLYWAVSKNTGNPLFPYSLVEMSEFQYALCSWSRQYDFAFESTNRPDEEIINDDIKFDLWYQGGIDRIEKEIKKSKTEQSLSNINGNEVFLPADLDGAREVYDLNDDAARNKIANREKYISAKGEVAEGNLPDVKQNLQMELNKARSVK